jgi:N-acylneuraminate cytidylyltransferase
MKTIALIPARGGSKRIPKKNLYFVGGSPLISYALNACLKSNADEVWVSSDNDEILNFSKFMGAESIKRSEELSTDITSTDDVMVDFAKKVDFDILVLVQATSPLVRWFDINVGINLIVSGKYNSVFSAISAKTNDILFWNMDEFFCSPVNFDLLNRSFSQTRKNPYFIETGAFFVITKDALLKSGTRYGDKIGVVEVPLYTIFQIDNIADVPIIECLIDFQNKNKNRGTR